MQPSWQAEACADPAHPLSAAGAPAEAMSKDAVVAAIRRLQTADPAVEAGVDELGARESGELRAPQDGIFLHKLRQMVGQRRATDRPRDRAGEPDQ
eukprot:CAMPEP_0182833566 /NCGR_PEP_ID=MMETSP0006_2-20121128/20373_1 /TAXON_ID=97485 /ORGANISM="Prymnesium parvum, Strain Texoma1" /LENGTH=95 /DNA_ID=CAMNT_0024961601 /DNA_START=480 /DNA_END=765 /DNA_ORIENTATION=+